MKVNDLHTTENSDLITVNNSVSKSTETTLQDATNTTSSDAINSTSQDATNTTSQDATNTTSQDATNTTSQDATNTTTQDATNSTTQDATNSNTKIERIQICGFCSFDMKDHIDINNINIIVGPNGSGKTNFLNIIDKAFNDPTSLKDYINNDKDKKIISIILKPSMLLSEEINKIIINMLICEISQHQRNQGTKLNYEFIIKKISESKCSDVIKIECIYDSKHDIIHRNIYCKGEHFMNSDTTENEGFVKITESNTHTLIMLKNMVGIMCPTDNVNERGSNIKEFFTQINENHLDMLSDLFKNILMKLKINYDVTKTKNEYIKQIRELYEIFFDIDAIDDESRNIPKFRPTIENLLKNNPIHDESMKCIEELNTILCNIVKYISNSKYKTRKIIQDEIDNIINIKNNASINFKNINMMIDELNITVGKINNNFNTRKNIFEIKNNNEYDYEKIQTDFGVITGKEFTIIRHDDDNYEDYEYYIIQEENKYFCSSGEIELIEFLAFHCINNNEIYLIDEPCVHLSYTNMQKLTAIDMFKNPNSQLIIITHNRDMINILNCVDVLHFKLDKSGKTVFKDIIIKKQNNSRLIVDKKNDEFKIPPNEEQNAEPHNEPLVGQRDEHHEKQCDGHHEGLHEGGLHDEICKVMHKKIDLKREREKGNTITKRNEIAKEKKEENENEEKKKKIIIENTSILFCDYCVLVEGYYDLRFFTCLLNSKFNTENKMITIIVRDGKLTPIDKNLDELSVDYHMIFDFDKLYNKVTKNIKSIDRTKSYNFMHVACELAINEKNNDNKKMEPISNIIVDKLCKLLNDTNGNLFKLDDKITYTHINIKDDKLKIFIKDENNINYIDLMNKKCLIWNENIIDLEGFASLLLKTTDMFANSEDICEKEFKFCDIPKKYHTIKRDHCMQ